MRTFWNEEFDDHGSYMESYGEGIGSATRKTIFKYVNQEESLLDAGCGPGWNLPHGREVEGWVGKYKGTDFASKFIDACREKYGESVDHSWEVQDARAMTEPDESWDVVLLQDIVEHTNGYEKPILEALRVAQHKVIVTFWRSLSESDEDDVKQSKPEFDDWGSSYSRPKLEKWLLDLVSDGKITGWHSDACDENRHHDFYVLVKGVNRG